MTTGSRDSRTRRATSAEVCSISTRVRAARSEPDPGERGCHFWLPAFGCDRYAARSDVVRRRGAWWPVESGWWRNAPGVELLVETSPVAGTEQTSKLDRAHDAVSEAFERAQSAIVAVAASTVDVIGRMGDRSVRPDQVEVKFGLKFSARGNVVVAGASGQATLEATLVYHNPDRLVTTSAGDQPSVGGVADAG